MRMRYQSYLMIMCSFDLRRCDELSGTGDSSFQRAEFKILAAFQILAFQNPEFNSILTQLSGLHVKVSRGFGFMNSINILILFFHSVTKNDEKYQPAYILLEQCLLSVNFIV